LFCHFSIGFAPKVIEDHSLEIISTKPSILSQQSSKEILALFPRWAYSPESSSNGVWSEPVLVKGRIVTKGYFWSHSTLARTLSNFSYVGTALRLVQVNCLLVKAISFRSRLSIIAIKMKGHLGLKLLLFFSSFLLIISKYAPKS
jgi:hypothetical protein